MDLESNSDRYRRIRKAVFAEFGFPLAELMVGLAIATVMTVIAIPSLSSWLDDSRLKSAARDLVTSLQDIKLEAIKRNTTCSIRFKQQVGGVTYDYITYVDNNENCIYDAADEFMKGAVLSSYMSGVGLDVSKGTNGITYNGVNAANANVGFDEKGLPENDSGGRACLTVFLKNNRNLHRTVILSVAGTIRIQK